MWGEWLILIDVHFGRSPYIRGWASHFNSFLLRTFIILRVARAQTKGEPSGGEQQNPNMPRFNLEEEGQ